jgi:hypothetical protein
MIVKLLFNNKICPILVVSMPKYVKISQFKSYPFHIVIKHFKFALNVIILQNV